MGDWLLLEMVTPSRPLELWRAVCQLVRCFARSAIDEPEPNFSFGLPQYLNGKRH